MFVFSFARPRRKIAGRRKDLPRQKVETFQMFDVELLRSHKPFKPFAVSHSFQTHGVGKSAARTTQPPRSDKNRGKAKSKRVLTTFFYAIPLTIYIATASPPVHRYTMLSHFFKTSLQNSSRRVSTMAASLVPPANAAIAPTKPATLQWIGYGTFMAAVVQHQAQRSTTTSKF